jgi:mannose-6-phosphate isomerase-like protein (cupin superfamily)
MKKSKVLLCCTAVFCLFLTLPPQQAKADFGLLLNQANPASSAILDYVPKALDSSVEPQTLESKQDWRGITLFVVSLLLLYNLLNVCARRSVLRKRRESLRLTTVPVITNLDQALQLAVLDSSVGIAHAALAGDADFRLHITKLLPGAKVKAHRHLQGEELYIISSGSGTLYTGMVSEEGREVWNEPIAVQDGDSFSISAKMLHQLHNTGEVPLVLIFCCPDSHLSIDREVVADFS